MDTRKYPNTAIYYCPSLFKAGLCTAVYNDEYLVHGVVDGGPGSGYDSVLRSEMIGRGYFQLCFGQDLRVNHIKLAKFIASALDPRFVVPFTLASLHNCLALELPLQDKVELIRTVLYEDTNTEVENFLEEPNIMEDVACDDQVPLCVAHLIHDLRCLTELTHGKGAKKLDRAAMRKMREHETRQFWADRNF
ncbi:hypothetical protein FKW77_009956 [Venturia effusa]|uniref:Uncharacterized protein n=1 Tax=Venturia effusa TaxID=50376 RepID=A0A517L897_9PEZI|nr:hypothetical protein FKW77_009956 [Venturia effusa]